jgi:hypothetical protein
MEEDSFMRPSSHVFPRTSAGVELKPSITGSEVEIQNKINR